MNSGYKHFILSFLSPQMPLLVLVIVLLTAPIDMAAAQAPDAVAATVFAEKIETTSLTFLTDTRIPRATRAKHVREVFARDFDMQAMARFALSVYWRSASEEQRAKYVELFEKSLVDQYTLRMEDFEGITLKPVKTVTTDGRDILVSREAHHTDGTVVSMEWRIRATDGGYKIVDLTVMGISMGLTLRGEFAEIIRSGTGGVDALLCALDKRRKPTLAQAAGG